ncbi:MAG: hypothetical protein ABI142_13910, partial [Bryocella sp.]
MGGTGAGTAALAIYGSAATPVDLGSGGGSRCCGAIAGAGGGSLTFTVSGTMTNNGTISANGGNEVGLQGGGGAGGTVSVTTAWLAGSGVFAANGGLGGEGGGGGGRVAVSYSIGSGFTGFSTSTASGGACGGACGSGTTSNGGIGTVTFFSTASGGSNLSLYQNFAIPAGTTATYNSITLQNGATMTIGGGSNITVAGALVVTANSTIVAQSLNNTAKVSGAWIGSGVTLNAGSVQVDAGSSINADGQGYVAQAGPGGGTGGNGASYGGVGGNLAASTTYGSPSAPVDLGSGGGSYESIGGSGGGAIKLNVTTTLANNGIISAKGTTFIVCTGSGACGGGYAGGGSGGSVYVTAGTLVGNGTFNADGGPNASGDGSGGGGGRVAIYSSDASSFSGFIASTASGGAIVAAGSVMAGSVGTTGFFDTSVTNDNLTTYQNFVIPAQSNVTYNSILVQHGATLTIGGGSTVNVTAAFNVTGNSTVVAQSFNNTAKVGGAWIGSGITLNAGSVQVDAGSSMTADAQGYVATVGPGAPASGAANGGSYGGVGGNQAVSTTYGSATAPVDLGSGGGLYQGTPGAGGGAIHLAVSGSLTNNGIITANGASVTSSNTFSGGGSGGSIYVTTATLAGAGVFTANGGSNPSNYASGGGGGRIAVYSGSATNFTGFTTSTATGGSVATGGSGSAGVNGTVAFFDTSAPNNNVSVYQNYVIPASSNVQYNSLTLASGATMSIGGGSQVIVQQALHISGVV